MAGRSILLVAGGGLVVASMCYLYRVGEPESVGIRERRQHASRYVAMAKAGQRVPVTERGRLVAYLVPAQEPGSILGRLEAAGQLHRATARGIDDLLPVPAAGEQQLTETLRAMRDEERR
jgi:prevent-host-death family protein